MREGESGEGTPDPRQGMRVLFGPIPHSHLCGYTEAGMVQLNVWNWNDLDLRPPPFEPFGVGTSRVAIFCFCPPHSRSKSSRSSVLLRRKSKVLSVDPRALCASASAPLQPHHPQQPPCCAVNMPGMLLPQALSTFCSLSLTVTRFSH